MARMWVAKRGGLGTPTAVPFIIGKSQTLHAGDWVVLATESGTSYTVIRQLTYADAVTADYTSTSVRGVLGIMAHSAVTDSSGFALSQPVPPTTGSLTASAAASPIMRVPQMAAALPVDPATGRYQGIVYVAEPGTLFWGAARTTAVGAVTMTKSAYEGSTCGLWGMLATGVVWASTTNCVDYGVATDSAGAEIVGKILEVNTADRYYNTSSTQCMVGMSVLDAYCQYRSAIPYAS